jgi:ADP-ribosylglycohydrolase
MMVGDGISRIDPKRIRSAWEGRISGCLLGKPLEVLSFRLGPRGVEEYLRAAGAVPLRNYVPMVEGTPVAGIGRDCCLGHIVRAEPDDDINYTVLALMLLEERGTGLETADVARAWLRLLPAGSTWTAEREAYRTLLANMAEQFVNGDEAGFDLAECSDNRFNEWIGAQIRADLYGWACPGQPSLAAALARRDAGLSHRGEGVHAAAFVAALAAAIPASGDVDAAMDRALGEVPGNSLTAAAVRFGRSVAGSPDAVPRLHQHYEGLSPVHAINNLALVVWAICSCGGDFSTAIGDAVSAGWDTDCNGATVGGLCGLMGMPIADRWTVPWNGRVGVGLAGHSELRLDDLVDRTVAVARRLAS